MRMDSTSGCEGIRWQPNELVRRHRTGEYLRTGRTMFWEYARETSGGERIDIAEVTEIDDDGVIRRHRIDWGWFGMARLTRSALGETTR